MMSLDIFSIFHLCDNSLRIINKFDLIARKTNVISIIIKT